MTSAAEKPRQYASCAALQLCASEINVQANNATVPGRPFKKRTHVRTHLTVAGNPIWSWSRSRRLSLDFGRLTEVRIPLGNIKPLKARFNLKRHFVQRIYLCVRYDSHNEQELHLYAGCVLQRNRGLLFLCDTDWISKYYPDELGHSIMLPALNSERR